MTRFPTPAHLASWARFAAGVSESAGRKKGNAGTGHQGSCKVVNVRPDLRARSTVTLR
jgi:hypothetical protein